jgi:hypothetical protein
MNKRESSSEGVAAAASGVAGLVATAAEVVGIIAGGAGGIAGFEMLAGARCDSGASRKTKETGGVGGVFGALTMTM